MNFNIESIKNKMLVKYPFFGSIVANVNYKEDTDISTAGTDGQIIYYNPKFLETLSAEEQIFIFAHEVCHIAFEHITRSEGKDAYVWNIATDAVINQFLKRDGLKLVKGGVDIAEAINYNAEELYDKLLKEKQQSQSQNGQGNQQNQQGSSSSEQGQSSSENSQKQNKNQSQGQGTSSSELDPLEEQNQDVGHDTHSMWKDALKEKKESKFTKENNNPKMEQKQNENQQKSKLQQEVNKISEMKEQDAFNKNLEEKRKKLEELKKSLLEQVMKAGTSTNGSQITINNIGKSKPLVDWRYILREAIKYDVDWSYKNSYFEDGVLIPNLEEQPMPETEILLDTSGSINEELLKNFLRECKNILQHSKLKVGCFDTEFYGFHEIKTEEDIENMTFEGGGGTDFDVAVNAFTNRVENKIIFTDGEANMPKKALDAIWIVFGETKINPKGAKVIQIDEEQLNSLYSHEEKHTKQNK